MAWTSFAALDIKAKDPCDVAKKSVALAVAKLQLSCNLKFLKSVFLFWLNENGSINPFFIFQIEEEGLKNLL